MCLNAQNPNAYRRYKMCSDSGKAYLAQRNFNRLPDEIIQMVDRDKNDSWLKRKEEGQEGLNRLEDQFTQADEDVINSTAERTLPTVNGVLDAQQKMAQNFVDKAKGHQVSTVQVKNNKDMSDLSPAHVYRKVKLGINDWLDKHEDDTEGLKKFANYFADNFLSDN